MLSQGTHNGIITFFFERQETQLKWLDHFQQATGSYSIRDYYIIYDKHKDANFSKNEDALAVKGRRDNLAEDKDGVQQLLDQAVHQGIQKSSAARENGVLGYGRSGSVIIKALQKKDKKELAIKIIPKKGKTTAQIEEIRDIITIYQNAQHHYVVRLEDYFENQEFIFMCLESHS